MLTFRCVEHRRWSGVLGVDEESTLVIHDKAIARRLQAHRTHISLPRVHVLHLLLQLK